MKFHVYMLRLQNGRIYVGSTNDLDRRYQEHLNGSGSHATSKSKPIELIYSESFPDLSTAMKREMQIKRWSRAKKLALAEGRLKDLSRLAARQSRRNN